MIAHATSDGPAPPNCCKECWRAHSGSKYCAQQCARFICNQGSSFGSFYSVSFPKDMDSKIHLTHPTARRNLQWKCGKRRPNFY